MTTLEMTSLVDAPETQAFLDKVCGAAEAGGDERIKQITRRLLTALFETMDEFDVTEDEFWTALNFVAEGAPEFGLWAAGLGIEHFLDMRMDAADAAAGVAGGTPRTIEGPLYVAGAPLSKGEARLDDGTDDGGQLLVMRGQVRDTEGKPVAGAIVDVWHANSKGNYSYFDKSQSDYNLRRRIETGADGRFAFRSILPVGYACPPGGTTERLMGALGRHGRRPAHIHFFVSAPGHRHLTTQLNLAGDPDLYDDFAFATRDGLIAEAKRRESGAADVLGAEPPLNEIDFDFVLTKAADEAETQASMRRRA